MTTKEFFEKLLSSQVLLEGQLKILSDNRAEVEGFLRNKFGQEPIIRYAGSKAKGTMIAESYDLDIVCYFPSSEEESLKKIHDKVQQALALKYLIEPKASAVRIKRVDNQVETDYHIDLVPGRFIDGSTGDAFLHVAYGGEKERMQTNIDTHISYIQKSGCQDAIKLMKLWKMRNNVPIKTFVMELVVVAVLKDSKTKADFSKSLTEVLSCLSGDIETMRLADPANSNNIVSEVMTAAEKKETAVKATESLNIIADEGHSLFGWQKVFDEGVGSGIWTEPIVIINPSKPHCNI